MKVGTLTFAAVVKEGIKPEAGAGHDASLTWLTDASKLLRLFRL